MQNRPYIGAIIQARLTSTRLPRKHLLDMGGIPLLEHLVNRVQTSTLINKVVIAAPHHPEACLDIDTFIGSETDVLDRFYQCAKHYGFDAIVRLTADCPLVPVYEINRVVKFYLEGNCDYVTNISRPDDRFGVPDGWDVECFSFKTLEEAWKFGTAEDREHVTPYMKRHSYPIFLHPLKLSVDTLEDYERVKEFYALESVNYKSPNTETLCG